MCLDFGTPKNNQFSIWDKMKFVILGVSILKHIMVVSLSTCRLSCNMYSPEKINSSTCKDPFDIKGYGLLLPEVNIATFKTYREMVTTSQWPAFWFSLPEDQTI